MKKLYVISKKYPWKSIGFGGMSMSDAAMKEIGCVGFMPIFTNKAKAKKFAPDAEILTMEILIEKD